MKYFVFSSNPLQHIVRLTFMQKLYVLFKKQFNVRLVYDSED